MPNGIAQHCSVSPWYHPRRHRPFCQARPPSAAPCPTLRDHEVALHLEPVELTSARGTDLSSDANLQELDAALIFFGGEYGSEIMTYMFIRQVCTTHGGLLKNPHKSGILWVLFRRKASKK